ncbi:hypothetical protein CYMTET_31695 [Cymbomonas tetramitiformis]|uniref:Uncharacterized protein n=1 Tax=Cymbomonas tetramitiformis TaxID=36881 RepID=A0AAE0FGC0_9CHLO|nr:hypothetical protein CYMTET_31695 [Cymbomonas tetramitiformis]
MEPAAGNNGGGAIGYQQQHLQEDDTGEFLVDADEDGCIKVCGEDVQANLLLANGKPRPGGDHIEGLPLEYDRSQKLILEAKETSITGYNVFEKNRRMAKTMVKTVLKDANGKFYDQATELNEPQGAIRLPVDTPSEQQDAVVVRLSDEFPYKKINADNETSEFTLETRQRTDKVVS